MEEWPVEIELQGFRGVSLYKVSFKVTVTGKEKE